MIISHPQHTHSAQISQKLDRHNIYAIATMALWQLKHLGTCCTVTHC